jgi:hypothetical protein
MGTKSAKDLDFERLREALGDYRFAYLVTVGDDYRVHTVTVEPELCDRALELGLIGGRTLENAENHSAVTLLWPPSEPGGYSLIVDGRAEVAAAPDGTARLRVAPTRALLHRNAEADAVGRHDCVMLHKP